MKKRIYLAAIERKNLQAAAALHFTSNQESLETADLALGGTSFITPHGLEPAALIPNARQLVRTKLGLPQDEKLILFLSRVHPKKGLEFLIPALARLSHTEPFTFILAGNSEPPRFESDVTRMLAQSGIAAITRRVGFVQGDWKQLLLQGSDLFALTSQSENFAISVLEAIAAGLRVVTTPGVALAEWVTANALGRVVPLDAFAIAEALRAELRSAISPDSVQRARHLVNTTFSWSAVADCLLQQYQRCLS